MLIKIAKIGDSAPVSLACYELKNYLSKIDKNNDYAILTYDRYDASLKGMLWVGLDEFFPLPTVDDRELDDGISIDVKGGAGYISGTNDRAVLIAVYRFLRELGCAFIRPGSDGEIIPEKDISSVEVKVFEKPDYRHRAICIEGAVSFDDVCDLVEWLPKVGMNGFYNQFRVPYVFYLRRYTTVEDEYELRPSDFTVDDARGINNEVVKQIKKRGLLYHSVGHGWTCEPFGIEGLGWFKYNKPLDENIRKHLALVNGKRDFHGGVPLDTNLCYSSPEVRQIMTDAILEYAEDHPETDYIHVWLADGTNNQCECEECKKLRPADYYVRLLNQIDEKLTEKGLKSRIVFLIYVDLLWGPIKEKLNNPDRFVLMFAPITRTYSKSMAEDTDFEGTLVDYNRNKNEMPASVAENIAHLRNWQKDFGGDSFDFDYHYMWDYFKDLGNYTAAKILFDDMKNLDKIGLNGMVSCQCVRAFFPHGLGMNAMAAALWDKNASFDKVASDYFAHAYGEHGERVAEYFKTLSELADPVFVRGERENIVDPSLVEKFTECKKAVAEFAEFIKDKLRWEDETLSLSYKYLALQNELAALYLDWEIALASGDVEAVQKKVDALIDFATKTEADLHRVFDAYEFRTTLIHRMNAPLVKKLEK